MTMKEEHDGYQENGNKRVKHQCCQCGKFYNRTSLKKHLLTHSGVKPYICKVCGQAYSQSGGLRNHTLSQHGADIVYSCYYCDKKFPIKDRLKLHLRVHTGEKPYSCDTCGKKFARGGQLTQHTRTHTKVKPYICSLCSSAFVCRGNLINHIKRHKDERDYICHECGKSFVRRDGLHKHLTWFHGNIKAFECKICKKRYKGHLIQHMRIHKQEKPHECRQCGAKFVQRSQLTVHERIHSGIRPYRCIVCYAAFAHSTALKMHVRRHTGEKPFTCVLCTKSFCQLPHLKKHMSSIHKTNKPYICVGCKDDFKTKAQLEEHHTNCVKYVGAIKSEKHNEEIGTMPLDRMRLLLAVLLQKISTPDKLAKLGYGKKLIDLVLLDSIRQSGREPCENKELSDSERLKRNVWILLEWTVPKIYMEKFKQQRRSMEELLEEFTS